MIRSARRDAPREHLGEQIGDESLLRAKGNPVTAAPLIESSLIEIGDDGAPVLAGGRNRDDGRLVFPMPGGAEADQYDVVQLPRSGSLWSFTIQRFPPVAPPYALDMTNGFTPYAVGYVDLQGQLIVESRLLIDSFDDLEIGASADLELEPLSLADGRKVTGFAFRVTAR